VERLSYDAWGKRRFPNGADDPTGSIGAGQESVMRDFLETLAPIVPVAGKDADALVGDMKLDTVAIELDFVDPARTARVFSIEVASEGSINPGKGALVPIAAGLLRWKAAAHHAHRQRERHLDPRC
jgi:hypothetical protein